MSLTKFFSAGYLSPLLRGTVLIQRVYNAPEALDVESWSLIIEAINTPTEERKEEEALDEITQE